MAFRSHVMHQTHQPDGDLLCKTGRELNWPSTLRRRRYTIGHRAWTSTCRCPYPILKMTAASLASVHEYHGSLAGGSLEGAGNLLRFLVTVMTSFQGNTPLEDKLPWPESTKLTMAGSDLRRFTGSWIGVSFFSCWFFTLLSAAYQHCNRMIRAACSASVY